MRAALLLLLALGCNGGPATDAPTDETDALDTDTHAVPWAPPEGGRVTLQSGDALLSARYAPAGQQGAPALILMNLPDGSVEDGDFPEDMLDRLSAEGWTWLIYEYRGTRLSGGQPGEIRAVNVFDLEGWSRKVADDGYPVQAIVDTHGAVSTPFVNNAPDTPGVPVPCSVTLAEAPLPEGLDYIRKTPAEVRRQFQYRPGGATERNTEATKEWDPGDWVYQKRPGDLYDKSIYWYEPTWIDDLIAFHRETFPGCQ